MSQVKILSIDGGGIRGVIPALILAEIEKRTGQPVAALFDVVAGTSTGGLLAMAAVMPDSAGQPRFQASELVPLYEEYSKIIFSRTRWDAIRSIDNWRVRRYPNAGIEETLELLFGDAHIDEALTNTLITSYDIEKRIPVFLRSYPMPSEAEDRFLMRDVVRATIAAPTFFEPAQIAAVNNPDHTFTLIDGGITANNPAMNAYAEAMTLYPEADSFVLVSLGTGSLKQPFEYDHVRKWGLIDWIRPLTGFMFDASNDNVDYQLQMLLQGSNHQYFRLQKCLDWIEHGMDDISPVSMAMVNQWGQDLINENDALIDDIANALTQNEQTQRRRLFNLSSLAFWRREHDQNDDTEQHVG